MTNLIDDIHQTNAACVVPISSKLFPPCLFFFGRKAKLAAQIGRAKRPQDDLKTKYMTEFGLYRLNARSKMDISPAKPCLQIGFIFKLVPSDKYILFVL